MVPSRRFLVLCLALVAGAFLPARPAGAQEAEDPAVARDLLATKLLEAAEIRMRAKETQAGLLASAGRLEEALAALQSIETIHQETLRLVAAVRAGAPGPSPHASPSRPRVVARPASPRLERPTPPAPIPFEPLPRDPVPAAVRYLLGTQLLAGVFGPGADLPVGVFLPSKGAAEGDPEADPQAWFPTTCFTLLALLDALPDGDPHLEALRRAGSALAGLVGADGRIGTSAQDQALGAWALAAALARLGEASWLAPLQRALAFPWAEFGARDAQGPQDAAVAGLWRIAALREAAHVRGALPEDLDLDALGRETMEAWGGDLAPVADPALGYARDLLRMGADLPREGEVLALPFGGTGGVVVVDRFRPAGWWMRGSGANHDPLALLLGTVYVRERFGTDDPREAPTWWNRALLPAAQRQRTEGPVAGSWDLGEGRGLRLGRVWNTAVTLLAWKAWDAPWREPYVR